MIYSAALHDDATGALVVEGLTDGQSMPLWRFAEGISDSGQQTLLHVIDTCWREIGGHLGDGTVCELVTTLELVRHELLFQLVTPPATRKALEARR